MKGADLTVSSTEEPRNSVCMFEVLTARLRHLGGDSLRELRDETFDAAHSFLHAICVNACVGVCRYTHKRELCEIFLSTVLCRGAV